MSASIKEYWVAVSGGFDPIHIGHVRMFERAKRLGDKLVVILNNDNWLRDKKGFAFMPEKERAELILSFPSVDRVVLSDHRPGDTDRSVVRTLRKVKPAIFANGGDRFASNIPEFIACKELGIDMRFNIGRGGKVQSSSWMIRDAARALVRSVRPWGEFYQWDQGKDWNLKTVYLKAGGSLSLQYHKKRSEWWMLLDGEAKAVVNDGKTEKKVALKKGEIFKVPKGAVHRLESKRGGVVAEIAFGSFDEADTVRLAEDTKTKS